jgi:hypothetical protein
LAKTTRAERAGGMAQAVECLPSEHKALSSNPSTKNNSKKENLKWPITLKYIY